jgi:iron complex transport system substrate-binding protein
MGIAKSLAIAVALLATGVATTLRAEDGGKPADTSRLIAIGGSLTEIVYALGEQERLIARDSTSIYPPEAFSLPDVGYMRALSPESVLSVGPSAIIALEGSGPKEAVDVLKKASVPYIEIADTFDHKGILHKIEFVGQTLGVEEKAKALAARVDEDLKQAEATTSSVKERRRVLFILSFQDGKILGAGEGTAANGILQLAGAENAVTGFKGYKALADEAVMQAAPEVILMMDRGSGSDHSALDSQLLAHPAIAATPAGKNKAIIRMDGAYLLGFGPRTGAAVRDLVERLYPASGVPAR